MFCRANTNSKNELSQHEVVTPNTHSSNGEAEETIKNTTTVTTSSTDQNGRLSCVCRSVEMCSCDTYRNLTSSASSSGKRKRRSSTKVSTDICGGLSNYLYLQKFDAALYLKNMCAKPCFDPKHSFPVVLIVLITHASVKMPQFFE